MSDQNDNQVGVTPYFVKVFQHKYEDFTKRPTKQTRKLLVVITALIAFIVAYTVTLVLLVP